MVENDTFVRAVALDHDGEVLTLYHKSLSKENVAYFIVRAAISREYSRNERNEKVNDLPNRLRVCKMLLPHKVKYVKEFMKNQVTVLEARLNEIMMMNRGDVNDATRGWNDMMIEDLSGKRDEWLRTIKAFSTTKKKEGGITDQDILRAKERSIKEFVHFNTQNFAKCLWHNEKSPSMKYYPKTNSVHCFGCGKSADVIDVVKQLHGDDFISAVKRLL